LVEITEASATPLTLLLLLTVNVVSLASDSLLVSEKDESDSRNELIEQIDLRASLLAGVAKNTERIIAKQVATSSLAAQANAGESPLESTAVIDAPLVRSISTTSIMPNGAAKWSGL